MAGYTRQSSFADGDTITAAIFNDEYNQLVNAFNNATGHKHDGTTDEGPVIGLIGDAGETSPNNKVLIDTTNNYIEFYIEVASAPVQQLYIADGAIVPVTDSDIDLGTTSLRFKDTYTDTVTTTGNVTVGGNLTVTGNATISGNLTFGDADTDSINLAAEIDSDIIPNTDGTYDLGSATKEWQDLYIDGTANIDSLVADTADINAGTIDNTAIGGTTASSGAFTTLTASGTTTLNGNVTLGDAATDNVVFNADVNSSIIPNTDDTYDLGSVTQEWRNLYVDGTANIDTLVIGTSTGVTSVDTDLTSVSASDDTLASAKAIKTYVDSQVTAQDLDFQGDTGGALSIDLDSETLTIAGGTGIDTSGATNTLTVSIDSTVATLTGTQTLTNKTLTSPTVNTATISGGTINNAIIGGTTPAAGTFTTLTANTSITGTLATAAQPNITSVGTLSSLTTSGNVTVGGNLTVNGTTTTVNSTTVTVDDPVITLGGDTAPASDDNKDRGVEFRWHNGTAAKVGFFGYDDSASVFTFIPDATNTSEVFSGSAGNVAFGNIAGTLTTAAQTNITSVGTLTSLTVSGDLTVDTDTLYVDSTNNYVGIGTSSPSFTLDAYHATDNGIARFTSGDADVYIALSDVNTTSTYNRIGVTTHDMWFQTNNAERLRIDSSGNVGIGTNSPDAILHIEGSGVDSLRFGNIGVSSNSALRISRDDTTISNNNPLGFLEFGGKGTTGNVDTAHAYIAAIASGTHAAGDNPTDLTFGTTPDGSSTIAEVMRISESGNVGIGTASPSSELHVSAANDSGIRIDAEGNNVALMLTDETTSNGFRINYNAPNDILAFDTTNGTGTKVAERMRIDSSGNVGIGTTSPDTALEISVGSTADGLLLSSTNASTSGRLFLQNATAGEGYAILQENGNLDFRSAATAGTSSGTQRVRIDSSGNVGIGTSSPDGKLDIQTSANESGILLNAIAAGNDVGLTFNRWTGTASNYHQWRVGEEVDDLTFGYVQGAKGSTPSEKMRIDSSGQVGIGTSSPSYLLHVDGGNASTYSAVEGGGGSIILGALSNTASPDQNIIYSRDEAGSTRQLSFQIGSTNRLTIDTSGNVGIGTSSVHNYGGISSLAGNILDVYHNSFGTTAGARLVLGANNTAADRPVGELQFGNNSNQIAGIQGRTGTTSTNGQILFSVNQSGTMAEIARFNQSGQLGIGTTAPSSTLHLNNSNPSLRWSDSDGVNQFTTMDQSGGTFSFITRNGPNVGSYSFKVQDSSSTNVVMTVGNQIAVEKSAYIKQVAITSSAGSVAWDTQAAANAYYATTENTTFAAPTNAVEGAIITVEIAQGATAYTVAWNTVFEFAASTAPTVTATANKTDIFSFRYNGSVWQEIGRTQNLAQT